jgi:hypothetical protein
MSRKPHPHNTHIDRQEWPGNAGLKPCSSKGALKTICGFAARFITHSASPRPSREAAGARELERDRSRERERHRAREGAQKWLIVTPCLAANANTGTGHFNLHCSACCLCLLALSIHSVVSVLCLFRGNSWLPRQGAWGREIDTGRSGQSNRIFTACRPAEASHVSAPAQAVSRRCPRPRALQMLMSGLALATRLPARPPRHMPPHQHHRP